MGPSIQSLRVFMCVLEQGSLSGAGRELGMTQPAVSNHLSALEERFGLVLVTRGRPLRATPAGEDLARHARRVLEELSNLETEMVRHAAPRGRLRVGVSSTPAELLLPAIAVAFSANNPGVALDVHVADTDETLAALLHRDIEVAIVGRMVDDDRLSASVVGEDELVLVVAADEDFPKAVTTEELADMPFVFRERGSATRRAVEGVLASAGITPRVAMELGSNAAVAGAVGAGAGIGAMSSRMLETNPYLRRLAVAGLEFRRPFVLVVERGRVLSPAAEAFAAACTGDPRFEA